MLILKRKPGESVWVNGPCMIHVLHVGEKQAKVGFEASGNVEVLRAKLRDTDKDEQRHDAA